MTSVFRDMTKLRCTVGDMMDEYIKPQFATSRVVMDEVLQTLARNLLFTLKLHYVLDVVTAVGLCIMADRKKVA